MYDSGAAGLAVFWHHGTPQLGDLPEPLMPAATDLGIRLVSFDRAGYGGSSRLAGRDVASIAGDVTSVADMLGIDRFGVIGASGGGPHTLACAALVPERVVGAVSIAGLAPFGADGLDWFAGMADAGAAELYAACAGRETLEQYLLSVDFDPEVFTSADHAALAGVWSCVGASAGRALRVGIDGMVDDDLAYVKPWGFDPAEVRAPVLLVHGEDDRMVPSSHSEWLADRLPSSELRLHPGEGHVSVLREGAVALEWLKERAESR